MSRAIVSRVRASGVHAASIPDLVAIGFSRREEDVDASEAACRNMLQRFGSLRGLADATAAHITDLTGLEGFEVLRAQALIEIGRRSQAAGKGEPDRIESADDAFRLLDWMRFQRREHFVAVLLDAKAQVMHQTTVHIGTLTMSVVGVREVFREAIKDGASSVIVAHNHPSGDPEPSPEDIQVTRQLVEAGKLLDIPVLDHVIIGERRAVSLRQRGYVE